MEEQIRHYESKLAFETDSGDLKVALESGANVLIIDARSPESFQREHIPGAITIPHRKRQRGTSTERLWWSPTASSKGALNMAKLGFRVKELVGGRDWWKRDGHKTECAASAKSATCGCE